MSAELNALAHLLQGMDVEVVRPQVVPNLNQIFARDVGIVVEDRLVATRMIADRADEWQGVAPLLAERASPPASCTRPRACAWKAAT